MQACKGQQSQTPLRLAYQELGAVFQKSLVSVPQFERLLSQLETGIKTAYQAAGTSESDRSTLEKNMLVKAEIPPPSPPPARPPHQNPPGPQGRRQRRGALLRQRRPLGPHGRHRGQALEEGTSPRRGAQGRTEGRRADEAVHAVRGCRGGSAADEDGERHGVPAQALLLRELVDGWGEEAEVEQQQQQERNGLGY